MRAVLLMMLIALAGSLLHCYALSKRIDYLENEIVIIQKERADFVRYVSQVFSKALEREAVSK